MKLLNYSQRSKIKIQECMDNFVPNYVNNHQLPYGFINWLWS